MVFEWSKDIEWKLHSPDKRIYLMRDHNWSFASWEIAKIEGKIRDKSLVVHVDSHLDDVPDGVLVKNLLSATTVDQIIEVSRSYDRSLGTTPESNMMQIDNFIWASLARGTIEEVIYVSRYNGEVVTLSDLKKDSTQEAKSILSKLPPNCNYRHKRYWSIESFLESFSKNSFKTYVGDRTAILDLDIDVFNGSDSKAILTPLHQIRELIINLMDLYHWDLITIAISPEFCGGVLEAQLILENVINSMNFDINLGIKF